MDKSSSRRSGDCGQRNLAEFGLVWMILARCLWIQRIWWNDYGWIQREAYGSSEVLMDPARCAAMGESGEVDAWAVFFWQQGEPELRHLLPGKIGYGLTWVRSAKTRWMDGDGEVRTSDRRENPSPLMNLRCQVVISLLYHMMSAGWRCHILTTNLNATSWRLGLSMWGTYTYLQSGLCGVGRT